MALSEIALQLKILLFDLHNIYTRTDNSIGEVIKQSSNKINCVLASEHAKIFFSQQQLDRLAPKTNDTMLTKVISTNRDYLDEFHQQFQSKDTRVIINYSPIIIDDKEYPYHILMKLTSPSYLNGYALYAYKNKPEIPKKTVNEIQEIINQHYENVCNHFLNQFIRDRNQILFQLSASLHSIYETVDVLKRVYRSIKLLYPNFEYRFLMSHEYDDTNMPIYAMEYLDNEFSGTKAFMNSELQIDRLQEEEITVLYAPLTGRQGVYGVIEVRIPRIIDLTKEDIDFINQTSKMIGRAVERTTLYQSSTQLITDLQHINDATRDLNRNLEQAEISETLKKHIVDSCSAEEVGIILLQNGTQTNRKYIITEESTSYFKYSLAHEFIEYLYDRLQSNPESILSGNFRVDDLLVPFNSVMVIPMLDSERMFGMIIIAHETPYYFSFEKYKFVQSFVQNAALAFTNSMLKEKLRKTAITDYLTQLYMRNHLDKEIDKHMNYDQGGAFILLDVDDFKQVNDTFGHYVGDRVLIQIANSLRRTLNENEIAARWGGEEFAIYLPYSNEKYAYEIAENIKKVIRESTEPKVTVSIGIATWSQNNPSIEELFIKADEALYEAKETGKNKIIVNY